MTGPDSAVLDNPVWHALGGPQRHVAQAHGSARRYSPELTPFGALDDVDDPTSWADLARLVSPGGVTILARRTITVPTGWATIWSGEGLQMTLSGRPRPLPSGGLSGRLPLVDLSADDIGEMVALVARTQPGPFLERTIELGHYVGIRDAGRLVAMAGERMRGPGFTEISAVCTDETARGHGLARHLVAHLVRAIQQRGETAVLHVVATNATAIAGYEAVGFRTRRRLQFSELRAPG